MRLTLCLIVLMAGCSKPTQSSPDPAPVAITFEPPPMRAIEEPPSEESPPATEAPQPSEPAPTAVGDKLTINHVEVQITSCRLTSPDVLTIRFMIHNLSKTKRVIFSGWQNAFVAVDEHENRYRAVILPDGIPNDETGRALNPGERGKAAIAIEAPAPVANRLLLVLDGKAVAQEKDLLWKIERSDWGG
jgi:hypothetical protein